MTALQAFFMAILQGMTELFPISSLGHAVIVPALLGWDVNTGAIDFLPFLVLLHLGTGTALLLYFWRDWYDLTMGALGHGPVAARAANRRLFWLLVLATIPAVIIGGGLETIFRYCFGNPFATACFLILNGGLLILGENKRRTALASSSQTTLHTISWKQALLVGFSQSAALFPGISRSGVTILTGLHVGLKHEDAARFSFLLATPIILGAAVKEIPKLHSSGEAITLIAVLAAILSGVTAYASVWFLMRYFGKHEFKALNPFGYYCLVAGSLSLLWLGIRS